MISNITNKELAEKIADDLFQNSNGDVAERLVLWLDSDKRNLGGWCKQGVVNRILLFLEGKEGL